MSNKIKFSLRFVVFLSVLFLNIHPLLAYSFPFREFSKGDSVPDVTLQVFQDNKRSQTFSELKGKSFVVVFWGADIPEKMKRSVQLLKGIDELSSFLKKRGVQLLSVNIQGDDPGTINKVISRSRSSLQVFLDPNGKAYERLGIFVMPTVLLVDKNGRATDAMGYSHDITDRLKGAVEIMLGEKTPEQVEAELRPEVKEKSAEEKAGTRHFDYGLVMLKRGQREEAIHEFEKALESQPGLTRAHIELGCIYLEQDKLQKAEQHINQGFSADPDSIRARICRSELKRKKGRLQDAIDELKTILKEKPMSFNAHYILGRVLTDQKQDEKAMLAYKKAYQLIQKQNSGVK